MLLNALQAGFAEPTSSRWEFLTTINFEWNYVTRKKKITWPLLVRPAALPMRRTEVAMDLMMYLAILDVSHLRSGWCDLQPYRH
jgi:hypothetical protein